MTFSEETIEKLKENPISTLNRGYRAKERIAARRERIESWRQIAESITARPDNTPGGSGPSKKIENCVLNIAALEEEIVDEINEIAKLEKETGRIIEAFVEDPNHKTVLELRYLNYMRWEAIAVEMGYTFRWTQELHRRAIAELSEKLAAGDPEVGGKESA